MAQQRITCDYVGTRHGRIHLRRCGEGPIVLFAHANPWTSLFWEPVLPLFADAGFGAVAFDALGYGNSDTGPAAVSVEGQAEVMIDLAHALGGIEAAVGWHQGAIVALEFALRQPEACPLLVMDGGTTASDEQAMSLARAVMAGNPPYPREGNEARWWSEMLVGRLRLFNPHFQLDASTWPLFARFASGALLNDPAIASSPSPMVPETVRKALTPGRTAENPVPYYDWLARLPQLQSPLLLMTAQDEPLAPAHAPAMDAAPIGTKEHCFAAGHPLIGVGREHEYAAPVIAFLNAHSGIRHEKGTPTR